jgi:ankyrin repeat protein
VKLLLSTEGVNLNTKDIDGWTPLLRAAFSGHKVVVKLLLNMEG